MKPPALDAEEYRLSVRLDPIFAEEIQNAAYLARQSLKDYVSEAIRRHMARETRAQSK